MAKVASRLDVPSGVMTVLCTPFTAAGEVDSDSLTSLVAHQLAAGVDAVVVHGLAGEPYKLSDAERDRVMRTVVDATAGTAPVIAGCGHSGTDVAVARARRAAQLGAAAVMALPPSFMKPTVTELRDYYVRIAEAARLPLIIQDAPSWTGVDISGDAVTDIAAASGMPVAVKIEAPPTASRVRQLRCQGIRAIGGYGALHLAEELDAGICGFMPGCALPALYTNIWRAHASGGAAQAFELYAHALPLLAFQMASLDTFIAAQKALLGHAGVIASSRVRSPGSALDEGQERWLQQLLERTPLPTPTASGQTSLPTNSPAGATSLGEKGCGPMSGERSSTLTTAPNASSCARASGEEK